MCFFFTKILNFLSLRVNNRLQNKHFLIMNISQITALNHNFINKNLEK